MSTAETAKDNKNQQDEIQELLLLAKVHSLSLVNITKLNLPNCGLSELPPGLPQALPNLSILFLPKNHFYEMPKIIGECPKLQMVSFKENAMKSLHPDALQPQLRWLILTDNRIQELPDTIGCCGNMKKLMLSGNQLQQLPDSIATCTKLELVRMASNRFQEPPLQLLQTKSLKWVALSNNPFLENVQSSTIAALPILDDIPESTGDILGQGAGGITRRVEWQGEWVAVKQFGGAMTSDGLPSEERRIACAASTLGCSSLIPVLGETPSGSLVMEYLDQFQVLAEAPSLETCSRDVYTNGSPFLTEEQAEIVLTELLEALSKLHQVGICHGDFYGHNILLAKDNPSNVRLSDFGAAFFYDKSSQYGKLLEQIELRAFAVLVEEVNDLLLEKSSALTELAYACRGNKSTFENTHIWWKQKQLARLASAFGVDDEEKWCGDEDNELIIGFEEDERQ